MKVLINAVKHFNVVMHHKFVVLKLCIKAGIPWRGVVHDMSKFSPTEFINGVKYFNQGRRSPIQLEKQTIGYSNAWLHHKGRNKHHAEYWYDVNADIKFPIMQYKYACEMICDQLAAGIVYQGKEWTKEYQLQYWKKHKDTIMLNDKLKEFEDIILEEVAKSGIKEVITKKHLKEVYDKCVK